MASPIIDFHVHAFPDLSELTHGIVPEGPLAIVHQARKSARSWLRPLTGSLHRTQTLLRHLPEPIRYGADHLSSLAPLAGLLMESTVQDLLDSMEDNEIDQALLIASPPLIFKNSNEFVLEAAANDPRLIPVVSIPRNADRPGSVLKSYVKKGARAVKIHPAADGEGPDSIHYARILKAANELGLPVILHTGSPSKSRVEAFAPWFADFPDTTFILAHMNFHEPQKALDLVLEHPKVHVDTSWQPAETIGEAVRRVGAERVLFASDWPLLGNNLAVGLHRIEDCVETGLISAEDSRKILGENAVRILKLDAT